MIELPHLLPLIFPLSLRWEPGVGLCLEAKFLLSEPDSSSLIFNHWTDTHTPTLHCARGDGQNAFMHRHKQIKSKNVEV